MRFIRDFLVIPRGANAGKPFRLEDFQTEIIEGAFAPGVRTGLVSISRSNGKTMLAAAIALAEMFVGPDSAEVLCVASDAKQASHVLKYARRMVELSPVLSEHVQIYSDRLYVPQNDAVLLPLSADPNSLHGYDPSLLIIDELHVVTEETWIAATSMAGKRPESLTLAISTPATTSDSIMWRLVQLGRSGEDPQFYFREWAAPAGCEVGDRDAWRIANPALTCSRPFLAEDGLSSALGTLREARFRQLRLGMWVSGVDAWLPFGAWNLCGSDRQVRPGEKIVLGFDGSASGDSTALVGCTLDGHVFVEGLWENPGNPDWRVPREEVTQAVHKAFRKYWVQGLYCDPWGWRSEIELWAKVHGATKVLEYNTAYSGRMGPATDRLYQAVMAREVTHDGDERLSAHIDHCVAKATQQGDVVTKDKRGSPRKVDAAVAAIVAFDRACHHKQNPEKPRKGYSL